MQDFSASPSRLGSKKVRVMAQFNLIAETYFSVVQKLILQFKVPKNVVICHIYPWSLAADPAFNGGVRGDVPGERGCGWLWFLILPAGG